MMAGTVQRIHAARLGVQGVVHQLHDAVILGRKRLKKLREVAGDNHDVSYANRHEV